MERDCEADFLRTRRRPGLPRAPRDSAGGGHLASASARLASDSDITASPRLGDERDARSARECYAKDVPPGNTEGPPMLGTTWARQARNTLCHKGFWPRTGCRVRCFSAPKIGTSHGQPGGRLRWD